MNETYISRQITVYKTDKALLEFTDKLKAASLSCYAHIHADGELSGNGYKRTSLIGILLKDYSNGTGDRAITVTGNISPEEVRFILSRITSGFPEYEFAADKIFGTPDQQGYSDVTKLRIQRTVYDQQGKPRRNPWLISLENGKGIPQKNANGGTFMKSNSFQSTAAVRIRLNDLDMFRQLNRVSSYITIWELTVGPSLIRNAYQEMERRIQQSAA